MNKYKKLIVLFCSSLFILFYCIPMAAEVGTDVVTAKVFGQVVNENGDYLVSTLFINNTDNDTREVRLTDLTGRFHLELPKANYELIIQRDGQYEKVLIPLEIGSRIPKDLGQIELRQLIDLKVLGWYGGDLHQHSTFSDGQDSPWELVLANMASGCDFAVLTDHNTVEGHSEFLPFALTLNDSNHFLPIGGVEVTSNDKGHYNVINADQVFPFEFKTEDDFKDSIAMAKSDSTFVQINHPSRRDILGFAYWPIISEFEGIEVWNGKDIPPVASTNLTAKENWFGLLSSGQRLTGTASSDLHNRKGDILRKDLDEITYEWFERGTLAGQPRTYVQLSELTTDHIVQALKDGRAFMSNGPIVLVDLAGKSYGDSVPQGEYEVSVKVVNNDALETLRVIKNGELATEIDLSENVFETTFNIELNIDDFFVIEVEAAHLGYALTNPIYCKEKG